VIVGRRVDLTSAPPMRLNIRTVGAGRVELDWISHHILLDGWSTGQVFTEVCEEYAAITQGSPAGRGTPPSVPGLPALAVRTGRCGGRRVLARHR
jgi:hypothetical protein